MIVKALTPGILVLKFLALWNKLNTVRAAKYPQSFAYFMMRRESGTGTSSGNFNNRHARFVYTAANTPCQHVYYGAYRYGVDSK